jgi:spermidine/putrescine transport system substrate-binding protein
MTLPSVVSVRPLLLEKPAMHFLKKPNVERLQNQLVHGRLGRREFMAASMAAGLVSVKSSGSNRAHAADGTMITHLTWSGYELPELFMPFVEEHGDPNISLFASAEDGLQKIRAGFPTDMAHPCPDDVRRWYDAGVLLPIDTSKLSHWPEVFPTLQNIEGGTIDGEHYMAVIDLGLSSILYRTDIYDGEETWAMMFDEAYAGRICASGTYINITMALAVLGYDLYFPTDEQVAEAAEMARKQRPLVRFYWESQTDMEQAMATGECVMAYSWNSSLLNLLEQDIPVAFASPKEGALGWACGIVRINTGEGDDQMAHDFIDAWLAPESGKYLIETYGYGHSNAKTYELVDPAVLELFGYGDAAGLIEDTTFPVNTDPDMDQKILNLWEEIQAGL